MFDLVLFDIDDTILEFASVRRDSTLAVLEENGVESATAEAVYQRFLEVNVALWEALGRGEIELDFLRSERYRKPLRDFGITLDPEAVMKDIYARVADDTTMLPDAREVLRDIAASAERIAVSNGLASVQRNRLKLSGLAEEFHSLVTPEMAGSAKPEIGIFDFALAQHAHVPRERILIVGDQLDTDVVGASRAGIASCWLNRGGYVLTAEDPVPNFEIHSLAELPAIVRGEHALVRFWRGCFGDFAQELNQGLGIRNPNFPVPLMSPNFSGPSRAAFLAANSDLPYFNEIGVLGEAEAPAGFRCAKQFYLGTTKLSAADASAKIPPNFSAEVTPLKLAIERPEFWDLLANGFGGDVNFLKVLLPFLAARPEAEFRTVFLKEAGRTVGIITVGAANRVALTLNAVVAGPERGRGISDILVTEAKRLAFSLGARETVFWTEHAFLEKHATALHSYRIYERG